MRRGSVTVVPSSSVSLPDVPVRPCTALPARTKRGARCLSTEGPLALTESLASRELRAMVSHAHSHWRASAGVKESGPSMASSHCFNSGDGCTTASLRRSAMLASSARSGAPWCPLRRHLSHHARKVAVKTGEAQATTSGKKGQGSARISSRESGAVRPCGLARWLLGKRLSVM